MTGAAIFLDRDGVINRNRADHVKSWAEFEFLPGVLRAMRRLAMLDCPIVIISNQAIIGRGMVSHQMVDDIHTRMTRVVEQAGGRIDMVLYCPHHPDEGCACRKPKPGLLLQASALLRIELSRSILVGDAETDVAAALQVGCQPVLVKTGRGLEQLERARAWLPGAAALTVVDDLGAAVEWMMQQEAWQLRLGARPDVANKPESPVAM